MLKTFVTSDLHLFHRNILEYCNRPFENTYYMNKAFLQNWNEIVSPEEQVYLLGDVAMGGAQRAPDLFGILNQLHGKIYLIKGNHDSFVLKPPCSQRFEWIKSEFELNYISPKFGERLFVMNHYPLNIWKDASKITSDGYPATIMLHGHSHGKYDDLNLTTTRMDVGVDSNKYCPIDLEEVIRIMNIRKYRPIDYNKTGVSPKI